MSDDRTVPARTENTDAAQLHDTGARAGSLIEQSLTRLNPQQLEALMAKAGEEALRLEVKHREQNMDYVTGKKAAEDHVETFNMLEKGGRMTRQALTSEIKTGAGNMRIESKSGATCFVASVAYDDPNHPDVMFLRDFRDRVLSKYESGRYFIDWYWENGPKLARCVRTSAALQVAARALISRAVKVLRHLT